MKKSSADMTKGNIAKQILVFAVPLLLGQIFQNLYNSVDMIVVGRAVGTVGLAAVSAGSDTTHLLVGFFTGLSAGAGIFFSRAFGAGDHERLQDGIHTALTFSIILGTCMALAGILLVPALLHVVDCPADVYTDAALYMRIYFVGILFTAMYNVAAGVLRAVGDSRSPFIYLVITSITNIVFDIIFVVFLHMGVAGAAFATIGSQLLSCILIFTRMLRTEDVYRVELKSLGIRGDLLKEILSLGLPAAVQSSIISVSNLFVARYVNGFGSSVMAGIGAAKKIDRFAGMIGQALGQSTATFVGQNYGAGKINRAFVGIRTCCILAAIYTAVMGTFLYIFAPFFIGLFITDPEPMAYGVAMMHTILPLYYCQSLNNIFANTVRGFGKSLVVTILSVTGMVGCRQLFLAISMGISRDPRNIYLAYPVGWGCAAAFVMLYYFTVIRPKYAAQAKTEIED